MAVLKIIKGVDAGTSYYIGATTVLGRDASSDIVINDSQASQKHARIIKQNNNFYLEDLHSTNGTYLNGKPIHNPELLEIDVTTISYFRIGSTWFSFGAEIEIEKINRILKDYNFLQELKCSSSIGRTFKVNQINLSRTVTLTLLPPRIIRDYPNIKERFYKQAQNLSKLSHENLSLILDFTARDNFVFYTTEYFEGETLATLLEREKKLSLEKALEIGLGIARGLAHAHQHNVLHLDVTPSNVFLHQDRIILTGIGIASLFGDIKNNYTGLFENIFYLSPEQIQHQTIRRQADIHALGVLMYEMLTGLKPFTGNNFDQIADSIVNDTPKAITSYNSDIPAEIEEIIYNCLEKEPEQRPQNCMEIADKFENILYKQKVISLMDSEDIYTSPLFYKIVRLWDSPLFIWIFFPCCAVLIFLIIKLLCWLYPDLANRFS